jgi:hypothetical protein
MKTDPTDWVAEKLTTTERLEVVGRTPENFLVVKSRNGSTFSVAVLGLRDRIQISDVLPLFAGGNKPDLVINVPSKAVWNGDAIDYIHHGSAAFGTLGDVLRAANLEDAGSFRDKNIGFFITSMRQHSNVLRVSYVSEAVLGVDRVRGRSLTVAVVDAYNMTAEDVRNARERFGHFDIVVKSSSYGSVTSQADTAARQMGAEALMLRELMQRLAQ